MALAVSSYLAELLLAAHQVAELLSEQTCLEVSQLLSIGPLCVHADGTEQETEISRIGSQDAYNWGYDPVHYSTPEGSYSSDADGGARTLEYRMMVQASFQTLPIDVKPARCFISRRCFWTHAC